MRENRQGNTAAAEAARELDELLRRAQEAPGVAEVMTIHRSHAAVLNEANAYLGTRERVVGFTTTDSAF